MSDPGCSDMLRTVPYTVRPVECFYAEVRDDVEAASRLLNQLEELGVSILAFAAIPHGSSSVQFTIVPEDPGRLAAEAARSRLPLEGPHGALLVRGDNHLAALASVHSRLFAAHVHVYASAGVSDEHGTFGYIVYVRKDQFPFAVETLSLDVELP
jgi:hypothetical protein